jgi:histidine ammonia-lyase
LGAVRDALRYCVAQVEVELNAVTDNPVILVDEADENKAFSAGLFHGEPVGFAADHLKLALCEVAAVSERRLYRLTTEKLSATLPPMLRQGPHLGLVIPQTSAAALVSENRQLAWPASVDSIPTCEDQEDIVAMSTTASRRAAEVLANSQQVVAIELLVAAHALWLRQKEDPHVQFGAGTAAALASVEAVLGGRVPGGAPADDMAILAKAIREGTVLDAVESAMGPLRGVR